MANMTVAVPDELHHRIKKRRTVNWSEVARRAFAEELARQEWLDEMDELTKDSKLTEADIEELDHIIKKGMWERYQAYKAERRSGSSSTRTG